MRSAATSSTSRMLTSLPCPRLADGATAARRSWLRNAFTVSAMAV